MEAGRSGPLSAPGAREVDEIDRLRSHEYHLLANLLGRAPTARTLELVGQLEGDRSVLGAAHAALANTARDTGADAASREFFDLFIGVGRGELLPYASYYLTGFLNERPLARVREDLLAMGVERAEAQREPEDHIALLLETMAGLASGELDAEPSTERRFFERHLKPWAERFFADLEGAKLANFYRHVGALGRLFMEVEAEAFAIDA
jgi:TorA maturation chaperone TorD